jgi:hypothetical protein
MYSKINATTILGLIFITLKLTGHITWSWWWVLTPFWIPMVIASVCLFIYMAASSKQEE